MVEVLVDAAVVSMRSDNGSASAMQTRTRLNEAADMLVRHKVSLLRIVPEHLLKAVNAAARGEAASLVKPSLLRFDKLELMDDLQVQENVEMARALQNTTRVCEAALAELDARICAAQGLASVRADRNPLRPQTFNTALRDALIALNTSPVTRLLWMQHMTQSLGVQLETLYRALAHFLKERHVQEASYAVTSNPAVTTTRASAPHRNQTIPVAQTAANSADSGQAGQNTGVDSRQYGNATFTQKPARVQSDPAKALTGLSPDDVTRLGITLEQLRDLLAGNALGDMTAVLAALQVAEPKLKTFAAIRAAQDAPASDGKGVHAGTKHAKTPSEPALAQEVVRMMVDNILQDERLLLPVREAVRALNSALIALAMHDPRYINDKTHPAMVLLDQITLRSLAFASVQDTGFHTFFDPVMLVVQNLSTQEVCDYLPFEVALTQVTQAWSAQQALAQAARDQAVQALLRVEQRNLLADKICFELTSRDDARDAPIFLKKFLIGAWAQVVAGIRLQEGNAQDDSHGYSGAVADLLWSCQIEQARKNRPRLVRTIPVLLAKLREGLASVSYPTEQSMAFFAELMQWHERALKLPSAQEIAVSKAALLAVKNTKQQPEVVSVPSRQDVLDMMQEADKEQAWLAPQEARDSGFMDSNSVASFEPTQAQATFGQVPTNRTEQPYPYAKHAAPYMAQMQMGCWVEFINDTLWVRAQLTWASPHNTLYMFTDAGNKLYTMTRKSLEKMVVKNLLRMVANEGVVVSALDAVAQTAVRNTINRNNP